MIKFKDAFKLAWKNLKRKSTKQLLFVVVLFIIFVMIIVPFSYYKSMDYSIDLTEALQLDFRTVLLDLSTTEEQYEKLYEMQEKYDFILKVSDEQLSMHSYGSIIEGFEKKDAEISLMSAIDGFSPDKSMVTSGRLPEAENEMICPDNFFSGNFMDLRISDGVNMKDYIGKTLKTKFYVGKEYEPNEEKQYKDFEYKVVGTYDADLIFSFDTCYLYEKSYDENIAETVQYKENDLGGYMFFRSLNDKDKVTKLLDDLDIKYFITYADLEFLTITLFLSVIATIILVIVGTIIILVYVNTYVKDNYKSLTLYKALGYDKRDIAKVMFLEMFILWSITLLISSLTVFICGQIIEHILVQITTYSALVIKIDILPILVYFAVTLLIMFAVIKSNLYKINRGTVRELSGE